MHSTGEGLRKATFVQGEGHEQKVDGHQRSCHEGATHPNTTHFGRSKYGESLIVRCTLQSIDETTSEKRKEIEYDISELTKNKTDESTC